MRFAVASILGVELGASSVKLLCLDAIVDRMSPTSDCASACSWECTLGFSFLAVEVCMAGVDLGERIRTSGESDDVTEVLSSSRLDRCPNDRDCILCCEMGCRLRGTGGVPCASRCWPTLIADRGAGSGIAGAGGRATCVACGAGDRVARAVCGVGVDSRVAPGVAGAVATPLSGCPADGIDAEVVCNAARSFASNAFLSIGFVSSAMRRSYSAIALFFVGCEACRMTVSSSTSGCTFSDNGVNSETIVSSGWNRYCVAFPRLMEIN